MKFILEILILAFLTSCFTDTKKVNVEKNDNVQISEPVVLPSINPRTIIDLKLIDESRFIQECQDSLTSLQYENFKNLPEITGINYFRNIEGKYYCNRTFSENFKTYIFYLNEGGDSGSSLTLMNLIEDTLITSKVLWVNHYWERGDGNTRTVFTNDSVFTITWKGFTNEDVKDSITNYKIIETYKIAVNGGLTLLNRNENRWNEVFNVDRWTELRKTNANSK